MNMYSAIINDVAVKCTFFNNLPVPQGWRVVSADEKLCGTDVIIEKAYNSFRALGAYDTQYDHLKIRIRRTQATDETRALDKYVLRRAVSARVSRNFMQLKWNKLSLAEGNIIRVFRDWDSLWLLSVSKTMNDHVNGRNQETSVDLRVDPCVAMPFSYECIKDNIYSIVYASGHKELFNAVLDKSEGD